MNFAMNFNVIGVGEVLWDLLLTGPQIGGAPANFAYHAHALGAQAQVITRVGKDDHGREIIRRFHEMGLSETTVQIDESVPTGTAKVALSGDGLAHFTIRENVAWDHLAVTPAALAAASEAHAICFGSLAQRSEASRDTIQRLVAAAPADALKVFDINLRQQFYSRAVIEQSLQLANVLKLNDDELPTLAAMFNLTGSAEDDSCGADTPVRVFAARQPSARERMSAPHKIKHQIECLAQTFSLRLIALTRGPNGSLLYQKDNNNNNNEVRWSDCPSRPIKVVDTVGAGDSFTAAMVLGLLRKMDLDEINTIANEVARYVCSQPGATPAMPVEFAQRFST
jgi:fructokinase